jgi:pyruvate dehydrogenase E2 component (dihydrolipoamide acetyltransferase)
VTVVQKDEFDGRERVVFTRMRRAIAKRMTESKQRAPHFYVETQIGVGAALGRVDRLRSESGARVTMTAVLARASALALDAHPELNAVWSGDELHRMSDVNVGIAIALDDGLVAPALLQMRDVGLVDTALRLNDLIERARNSRLRPEEMTAGTFTLSNLGMFDVTRFTAIITPPQIAILATGRVQELVRWADGEPQASLVLHATVSADHRAVDGADVARFLSTLKRLVENPGELAD